MALASGSIVRLRAHLAQQEVERPVVPFGDSLVFVTDGGLAINRSWFTKHFQSLLRQAGLPTMRLHDMRHGAASLLVGAGAHPRVAQELLRHAPGSRVTMERYAHVTARQQREAANLLELAVAGDGLSVWESVTESVTESATGVASSPLKGSKVGDSRGESGSGGRTRTYDQAVNSRPLYH